jgi:hypothetical protein
MPLRHATARELRHLRYFVAAAEEGTLTTGAELPLLGRHSPWIDGSTRLNRNRIAALATKPIGSSPRRAAKGRSWLFESQIDERNPWIDGSDPIRDVA